VPLLLLPALTDMMDRTSDVANVMTQLIIKDTGKKKDKILWKWMEIRGSRKHNNWRSQKV